MKTNNFVFANLYSQRKLCDLALLIVSVEREEN